MEKNNKGFNQHYSFASIVRNVRKKRASTVSNSAGFTLIELLIVIGVLGILAGIILVAVDPAKRLRQARDARRSSEVNGLLNAILNYTVDNVGTTPSAIDSVATNSQQLGTSATTCGTACALGGPTLDACANLTTDLVDAYIAEIPIDPKGSDGSSNVYDALRTGYFVNKTANGRIQVGACNPEDVASISIKR